MKFFRDTWILFTSYLVTTLRNPVWIMISLFQPIAFLLLFAPLLDSALRNPNNPNSNALNVFTPGMLVLLALFGSSFVGFGIISELRAGVVERLRVTPVSRLAPLLARALRDGVILLVQAVLLIIVAFLLGLKADLGGIAISMAIVLLMGIALASISYALGLLLKDENAFAPLLNIFILPIQLLSGILLPLSLAPDWLQNVAKINPFYYIVEATRALFAGTFGDVVIWGGFAVAIVISGLGIFWASRVFRQATA